MNPDPQRYFPITVAIAACLLCSSMTPSHAQDAVSRLSEVLVEAEAESEGEERVQGPFLPDVQGTRIYSCKKTSIVDLDRLPRITNKN